MAESTIKERDNLLYEDLMVLCAAIDAAAKQTTVEVEKDGAA